MPRRPFCGLPCGYGSPTRTRPCWSRLDGGAGAGHDLRRALDLVGQAERRLGEVLHLNAVAGRGDLGPAWDHRIQVRAAEVRLVAAARAAGKEGRDAHLRLARRHAGRARTLQRAGELAADPRARVASLKVDLREALVVGDAPAAAGLVDALAGLRSLEVTAVTGFTG